MRAVNQLTESLQAGTDSELRERTNSLREQLSHGVEVTNESILIPALALAKQSLIRTVGLAAYDVQVLAGLAMCRGAIAEMQTGEGKTLASMFPIVAHALTGRGVHVATVNKYLAERDFNFLRPALQMLGFSVGLSQDGASAIEKRTAYQCDVTFSTGYELGFDFLRDQIALMSSGQEKLGARLRRDLFEPDETNPVECQRGHAIAIVDEIDSVLIDEAITPLVLSSGGLAKTAEFSVYHAACQVASELEIETDFYIDRKTKAIYLTEVGSHKAHAQRDDVMIKNWDGLESNSDSNPDRTPFDMLADLERTEEIVKTNQRTALLRPWRSYVESALRAKHLMIRDANYVVREGSVEIVDEYTGRIFSDRNWRDGLHQAVEAKEGVAITEEKRTLARISRQRYFQRYDLLCGMTGTVKGHQRELLANYKLPIVIIPLRKPSQRQELPARYHCSEENKIDAIVTDLVERHGRGQPVLVGTRTIEQCQRLSARLSSRGIRHEVLNGIQDAEEATLVAQAGCFAAVTIATNMAGRGTDIKPDNAALDAGGLHVIGYERNQSGRIDRQLLGRAGRQGEPGSGQFHVSADDEIVLRYDPGFAKTLCRLGHLEEGNPNAIFDQRIQKLQNIAERETYQSRCEIMREELWLDDIKKALS